jgi:ABC-type transport system involved in multi-copper enzyme maturation permease subunit
MALAVFASSGLIPRVLEPGRIELLLSKPISRHHILLGRYLGNVLVVGANISYLVVGVWVILGIKTGIWGPQFLVAILTTLFIFSVLLTVVLALGVAFESSALATMVTMGLMILSPILAQTGLMTRLLSSETSRNIWRGLYYVFPKIFDLGRMTLDIVRNGKFDGWMPVWSSALFAVVVLGGALYHFSRRDF